MLCVELVLGFAFERDAGVEVMARGGLLLDGARIGGDLADLIGMVSRVCGREELCWLGHSEDRCCWRYGVWQIDGDSGLIETVER